jgi:hypothetical protein
MKPVRDDTYGCKDGPGFEYPSDSGCGGGAVVSNAYSGDLTRRRESHDRKCHSGKIGGPPPWPTSRRRPEPGRALRRLVALRRSVESSLSRTGDLAHPPPPERKSRPGDNRSGNPQPKPAVLAGPVRRFKNIT